MTLASLPVERTQHGVLTRPQAAERFGRAAVRRHLLAGRWVVVGRAVVLHNGPLRPEQVLWAALLSAARGAVLGSWSALAFDGLPTTSALPPHVVIPDGARRNALEGPLRGTLITRSAVLDDREVHPGRLPARTRPPRSVVDAAVRARSPDQARLALVRGVQAGVVRPGELREALRRRGRCRHLGLLLDTVDDLDGGVRSLPERQFAALVRRAGLPEPARQVAVRAADGRYHLDADWPRFGLSAEVHGIHHALAAQLEQDWRRHNDLTLRDGRRVLHFTSHQVRTNPEAVAAALAAAMFDLPTSTRSPDLGTRIRAVTSGDRHQVGRSSGAASSTGA